MDCHDALLQLEVARPGSDDLKLSEFESASAHLDSCRECRASFRNRQAVDGRISETMLDVPIPAGLKERLLESLNLAAARSATVAAGEKNRQAARFRKSAFRFDNVRVRIAAAVCISACLLAALLILFPTQPPRLQFTLNDACESANLNSNSLDPFDGNFEPKLPQGPWRRQGLITVVKPPKGDLKDNAGVHRAASYAFRVRDGRGRAFDGVLLVIPESALDDEPAGNEFSGATAQGKYWLKGSGKYHAVAWKSGKYVYVCFIPIGDGLKALDDAIYPPMA